MGFREHNSGHSGTNYVIGHFRSLEITCEAIEDENFDLVAKIGGHWKEFQVKSSMGGGHFTHGGSMVGGKPRKRFSEYKCDAFAFCFLVNPFPFYVAKEAVADSVNIKIFSRGERDRTFEELLVRWGVKNVGPFVPRVIDGGLQQNLI